MFFEAIIFMSQLKAFFKINVCNVSNDSFSNVYCINSNLGPQSLCKYFFYIVLEKNKCIGRSQGPLMRLLFVNNNFILTVIFYKIFLLI